MAKKIKISRFSSSNGAPKPPNGRFLLYSLIILVLLLVGFLVGRNFSSNSTKQVIVERKSAVGESPVTELGPTRKSGLIPVGYEHSVPGAITAATSYISITPQLYIADQFDFDSGVRRMSSATFYDTLHEGLSGARAIMRTNFQKDLDAYYAEIPVGNTVTLKEDDRVQISIYSIVMLVAEPEFNGQTEGKVHNMELIWEKGDWRINNWSTENAPTPLWSTPNALSSIEDFKDFVGSLEGGYSYVPSL